METTPLATGTAELADLLAEVEAAPAAGAARLRAAAVANRLAQRQRDPWLADVAEALAEEDVPGATRSLREGLREQSQLARQLRRAIAGDPERAEAQGNERELSVAAGA